MSRKRSWSDDDLKSAVSMSKTYKQVLIRLGLSGCGGGSYASIKHNIIRLGLDASHFTQKGGNHKGARKRIPDSAVFIVESAYTNTYQIKRRMVNSFGIEYKCYECGIDEWHGKPITLELDHINGVSNDNRIENLRLMCPNCHSMTDTYCGKNIHD